MSSVIKVGKVQSSTGNDAISISSSGAVTLSSDFVPSTSLSHRNLIINGDFRINQRGKTSRIQTSSDYNYDRWYWDGTYLYQGVEDINVRNVTFTLSWADSGSDITAQYVLSTESSNNDGPDSGLTWTSVSNGGQITVNETTEYSKHLWIRFGGTVVNLSKVQLEEGSAATPFEHRSYEDELKRCFRYFERYTGPNLHGGLYASNAYLASWFFKARKRTRPTISGATGQSGFTANNSSTGDEGGTDSCYFQASSGSLYVTTCSASAEL